MSTPPTAESIFLGDGAVASLMRSYDWSDSPLGHPNQWSPALRTIVSLMLNSKFPMFLAWGPQLALLYNDAYAEILGNKHPDSLGQPFRAVWYDVWADITPIVDQAMSGQASFHEDLPLTMQRKGYVEQTWFTFSYSPAHDEHGNVAGLYCVCTETTQQVLASRQRKSEIERQQQFFQQAPGIMAVLREPEHVFELANEAYYQLVGNRELIGRSIRDALPEIEGQGLYELLDRVYQSGEPYVGRGVPIKLRQADSELLKQYYVDFVYQPIRDSAGQVSGIFIEGSDVTDAVKANHALRESEKHLRQLANTIPHLAWLAEPDGQILWFNDRWYEYTGTSPKEMEGWGWQSVHDPKRLPDIIENYKQCLVNGDPMEMTFPLRSASGEFRTFFTRATPLRDEAGKILQWLGTNTDIHEMEQVQEELKAANRRKDEFLAMLAHELRNPLAPISSASELLKLSADNPQRVKTTSEIISRQVLHMTGLIDDLLDVSRVTRGLITLQNEPLSLKHIINDAQEQVSSLIEQKHQHLFIDFGSEDAMVLGDRTRLTQIIANILNNANRYTSEQGHIHVSITAAESDVAIVIEDNGIGIDDNLLPHVFDLFTQAERSPDRAQGGLGLGLALVKSLTDLHEGSVMVESDGANCGSKFTVRLPRLHKEAPLTAQTSANDQQAEIGSLEILIVDDNEDAAQALAMLLEMQGHQAYVDYRGETALARITQTVPHAMILDIGLPDMDGYELASKIRAEPRFSNTTIIALTGYGQSEDRKRSKDVGFDHHLVKPVRVKELLAILNEIAL